MKGYKKIGETGRCVFEQTHEKHLSALGEKEKQKYSREEVTSVKANNKEGCIDVRFSNGEVFKYKPNGTWY